MVRTLPDACGSRGTYPAIRARGCSAGALWVLSVSRGVRASVDRSTRRATAPAREHGTVPRGRVGASVRRFAGPVPAGGSIDVMGRGVLDRLLRAMAITTV